jgi:hypothetical protein
MFVVSVGIWGSLLNEEQLKDIDLNSEYIHEGMNEMMKSKKQNKIDGDRIFEERKTLMKEKLQFDGSKEGQEILSNVRENPLSVRDRAHNSSKTISELEKQLFESQEINRKAEEKYKTYTVDEIQIAEEDVKNLKIK